MDQRLRQDADYIIQKSIQAVMPDASVKAALAGKVFPGKIVLVAVGKAAWQMAKAAYEILGNKITEGIVITKYDHSQGPIGNLIIREAGHPTPDTSGFAATGEALELVKGLTETDTVLFLLSGGGSALFEQPLVSGEELQDITKQLLACGAEIGEINCIRKRLSGVKGGKFALACMPAEVYNIVLSDVLGDRLDVIASGPAYPDSTTCHDAVTVAQMYRLNLTKKAWELLKTETPKVLRNVETIVNGSVRLLCEAAAEACRELGYEPRILTDRLNSEAKNAGYWLAAELKKHDRPVALIAGGETVVKLTGNGKGGRNQELALAAALGIRDMSGSAVFSIGSDGTDGPTDAAGGYVDSATANRMEDLGILIEKVLEDNDSYHALKLVDGLIITGPTGTNVNDVAVALRR